MSEEILPDELAQLEAMLESQTLLEPPVALRKEALANVHGARAVERRLLHGASVAIVLVTLALAVSRPVHEEDGPRSPAPGARLRSEVEVLARLGFDSTDARRAALALAKARVPCVAPVTGSGKRLPEHWRGL
jgi:hypothetical protein